MKKNRLIKIHTGTEVISCHLLSLQNWGGIPRQMDRHRDTYRETKRWSYKTHFIFPKEGKKAKNHTLRVMDFFN
jgi:hypothetical protein